MKEEKFGLISSKNGKYLGLLIGFSHDIDQENNLFIMDRNDSVIATFKDVEVKENEVSKDNYYIYI